MDGRDERAFRALRAVVGVTLAIVAGGVVPANAAAAGLALVPQAGPPTLAIRASGSGFAAFEQVDLSFDAIPAAVVTTDASGSFDDAVVRVPADSTSGAHLVSALGRVSGVSAQDPFTVRTNWAQFHARASRQGLNRTENVLSPTGEAVWTFQTEGLINSSPAVADCVVYIGSFDGKVYALNAWNGDLRWSYQTWERVYGSPAVANGVVYVGSWSGRVYALDAATGADLWNFSLPPEIEPAIGSSPAVVDGRVYIGTWNGMYAFGLPPG